MLQGGKPYAERLRKISFVEWEGIIVEINEKAEIKNLKMKFSKSGVIRRNEDKTILF